MTGLNSACAAPSTVFLKTSPTFPHYHTSALPRRSRFLLWRSSPGAECERRFTRPELCPHTKTLVGLHECERRSTSLVGLHECDQIPSSQVPNTFHTCPKADQNCAGLMRTERHVTRKCHVSFENTAATTATTAVQCHVARSPDTLSTGSWSRRSAEKHTTVTVKRPPPHTSDSNHLHNHANHARKSCSDVPIGLPGWECHTGGSRPIPTVHPCGLRSAGCG